MELRVDSSAMHSTHDISRRSLLHTLSATALAASGVPIHFIRGNRDFLLGDDYARRAGISILPDPAVGN